MANERVNITSPVGRFVMGSLYKPRITDYDGKPLVFKTGQNAGQPRVDYYIALAIPKQGEGHWGYTVWGAQIWQTGCAKFPVASQRTDFAWKIEDGDSTAPNRKNRRPCDNDGWRGHWIIKLSGAFAPKIYKIEGGAHLQVTDVDFIKPGYWMQVAFNVDGNGNEKNPGVYLNHSMVCFSGFGQEISFGPNVEEAGFGAAPLPAGVSAVPLGTAMPIPGAPPTAPGYPVTYNQPPATLPPAPVYPNPRFLQVPPGNQAPPPAGPLPGAYPPPPALQAAPAPPDGAYAPGASPAYAPQYAAAPVTIQYPSNVPPAPPMAPAPSYRMTEKAAGATREAFHAANWTDAQLIQQGFMLP